MEITTQLVGAEMHVALQGRLDAAWSGAVQKTLQDAIHGGCHHLALDLAQVDYLSSAGIRVLVLVLKKLQAIGGNLRLSAVSPQVSEVLRLVGFQQLLAMPSASAGSDAPTAATSPTPQARLWQYQDNSFEVYDLQPHAVQQGRVIGDSTRPGGDPSRLRIGADCWAIGLGALGNAFQPERAGELLAVSNLALALPANDPGHSDWLLREGALVPEIQLLHGLYGEGRFRHLLRFGTLPESPPLQLSALLHAVLQLCGSEYAAVVMLAETAQLVGAALQQPICASGEELFAFPGIRDRLLFTAEPAYGDATCLIAGIAARQAPGALAGQLRPLADDDSLFAHLHAGIVPFNPVRKGCIELEDALEKFIDSQTVRGLLHLLSDDREGVGAGESSLRRGALWCAPITFTEA